MTENYYTLSQITEHVRKLISRTYTQEYWIKAEIAQLNYYPKSGHCYPDLVEKNETGVKAQIRGVIWKGSYERILEKFRNTTGRQLTEGMEILFKARLDYSSSYGFAFHISDIDPEFSLGKMAAEKLKSISRLKDEHVFFANKALNFPFFPKRIAIISVETSKGFHDFKNIVDNNTRGYRFFYMLFPALLQGDEAVDSIAFQLERIRKVIRHFDLVAIIRGGGGDVGLNCYNDYNLARLVATFPIPVISGIGHSTNETVVEMVAHKNAITPTDLAYFLQQKFDNIAVGLDRMKAILQSVPSDQIADSKNLLYKLGERIKNRQQLYIHHKNEQLFNAQIRLLKYSKRFIPHKKESLLSKSLKLSQLPTNRIARNQESLHFLSSHLKKSSKHFIKSIWQKTHHTEEKITLLDPVEILKKGFSITRVNGKIVKGIKEIKEGDLIENQFSDGKTESKILKISK
ncbi:MAG: exodeoxyribonuclease VII large subunit [Bacteroidales bacterium]|nr:exodeoxyribonuclease VII large subunit [Bacteroidales bacterium]